MDYFALFQLPEHFVIDLTQLGLRYQELQRRYHPDRFATATEAERLKAIQQAAMINDAYQTLKHPLRRAEYILKQHNVAVNDEHNTMNDTAFLMEQMELREKLDEIAQKHDHQQLLQFSQQVNRINSVFYQDLSDQLYAKQWTSAVITIQKLQFFDKLLQQIEHIEDKIFDGM